MMLWNTIPFCYRKYYNAPHSIEQWQTQQETITRKNGVIINLIWDFSLHIFPFFALVFQCSSNCEAPELNAEKIDSELSEQHCLYCVANQIVTFIYTVKSHLTDTHD